jgi:hypothetical protein
MRRLLVPGLLLFGLLLLAGRAAAEEAKKEEATADPAKIAALVRQLGADSFQTREEANAQLEKLGKSAIKALEDGAKDGDAEISMRSRRLLALATRSEVEIALDAFLADKDTKLILKLPSYDRYKKIVGDDQASRVMFVEMYSLEGHLLALADNDPKGFETAFQARCQQIQQTLYTPQGQLNPVPLSQVVALLFAATENKAQVNINSFYMVSNLLYQQNVQQGFKNHTGARKLLAQFFEQRTDENTMPQAINLAMQLEIKEMAPVALKAATNKNTQQWTRATALLAVGKLGTKDNIKDIEPMLTDTTNLGTMQFNQTRVTTEMRDVALASMIMLSGQDVLNYNFPYLKAYPQVAKQAYLGYNYFGFTDNDQRDAAVKQFKASQGKDDKDKKDEPKKDEPKKETKTEEKKDEKKEQKPNVTPYGKN